MCAMNAAVEMSGWYFRLASAVWIIPLPLYVDVFFYLYCIKLYMLISNLFPLLS